MKRFVSSVALIVLWLSLSIGWPGVSVVAGPKGLPRQYFLPMLSTQLAVESLGPDGGGVTAVLFDPQNPSNAYLGSWGAGMFKSEDGGQHWFAASAGLGNLQIQSLAIDPIHPQIVYAGTYRGGVYKTTNGGATWFASGSGLNAQAIVYALEVDPQQPQTLYAGTRSPGSTPPWGGGVYKSSDGGQTWSSHSSGLGEDWVYDLAIDPHNPQVVYAATHSAGVYTSSDGGHSWKAANNGISDQSMRTVAIDPLHSHVVYAGCWHGAGVFKSSDSGQSWVAVNKGIQGTKIISLAIDPALPTTVYALSYLRGLYKSEDAGASWSAAGLYPDYVFSLAISPANHQVLLASAENDTLFRSTSSGLGWAVSSSGVHATSVTALAADDALPGVVYAGLITQGVYRSSDHGQTWSALNHGLTDGSIRSLTLSNGSLLAGTAGGSIFKIASQAQDWLPVAGDLSQSAAKHWVGSQALTRFSPSDAVTDYAVEARVAEGGAPDAKALLPGAVLALMAAPSAPNIVYAGTAGGGVYRSVNGGDAWQAAGLTGKTVLSLAVDAVNPARLWAGVDAPGGSLWYSSDAGQTWAGFQSGLTGRTVNAVVQLATHHAVLFAATDQGVFQSVDEGHSWHPRGLAGQNVYVLAAPAAYPGLLLAGTPAGPQFSSDTGTSWSLQAEHMINPETWSIAVGAASSQSIYFGTSVNGVYRLYSPEMWH